MLPWIVILAVLGLLLVIVEVLLPGFGIFGIFGVIGLFASLSMIAKVYGAVAFFSVLAALIVIFFILLQIAKRNHVFKKMVLTDQLKEQDFNEEEIRGLEGQEGRTVTPLKPYGKAEIDGRLIDVFSLGEYIEKDRKILVVQISGKNVTVKEILNTKEEQNGSI